MTYINENCTIFTLYALNDFFQLSVVCDELTGSYRQDNIAYLKVTQFPTLSVMSGSVRIQQSAFIISI